MNNLNKPPPLPFKPNNLAKKNLISQIKWARNPKVKLKLQTKLNNLIRKKYQDKFNSIHDTAILRQLENKFTQEILQSKINSETNLIKKQKLEKKSRNKVEDNISGLLNELSINAPPLQPKKTGSYAVMTKKNQINKLLKNSKQVYKAKKKKLKDKKISKIRNLLSNPKTLKQGQNAAYNYFYKSLNNERIRKKTFSNIPRKTRHNNAPKLSISSQSQSLSSQSLSPPLSLSSQSLSSRLLQSFPSTITKIKNKLSNSFKKIFPVKKTIK